MNMPVAWQTAILNFVNTQGMAYVLTWGNVPGLRGR